MMEVFDFIGIIYVAYSLFCEFDRLSDKFDITKIETVAETWLCAGGLVSLEDDSDSQSKPALMGPKPPDSLETTLLKEEAERTLMLG